MKAAMDAAPEGTQFFVVITLPNGTVVEVPVNPDGTFDLNVPDGVNLKAGEILSFTIKAVHDDQTKTGQTVLAVVQPADDTDADADADADSDSDSDGGGVVTDPGDGGTGSGMTPLPTNVSSPSSTGGNGTAPLTYSLGDGSSSSDSSGQPMSSSVLPSTGDETSAAPWIGAGLLAALAGLFSRKRRKANK
ncbi:peptidoglycan bound protein (LPXTG motif) [Listeria fleischmannii 1991]|uniref:Peptidoglycan bound protein (LPXTG motif) n=1 Tax=Listeria fleischmannii 1991 TaxID=1430899 RepID=A0A0J8G5W7_9LIST|nr:peptidoglycan bound protein (LPXTG motif) [Listeria fleischmannii 1991]